MVICPYSCQKYQWWYVRTHAKSTELSTDADLSAHMPEVRNTTLLLPSPSKNIFLSAKHVLLINRLLG